MSKSAWYCGYIFMVYAHETTPKGGLRSKELLSTH